MEDIIDTIYQGLKWLLFLPNSKLYFFIKKIFIGKMKKKIGIPLALAKNIFSELKQRLVFMLDGKKVPRQLVPIGSIRRQEPWANDIDVLVIISSKYAKKLQGFLRTGILKSTPNNDERLLSSHGMKDKLGGIRRRAIRFQLTKKLSKKIDLNHVDVDLFLATEAEKAYALFHYTGSKMYNIRTRALAKKRGLLLNQYGLFYRDSCKKISGTSNIKTERDITKFLGISYRSPTNRLE